MKTLLCAQSVLQHAIGLEDALCQLDADLLATGWHVSFGVGVIKGVRRENPERTCCLSAVVTSFLPAIQQKSHKILRRCGLCTFFFSYSKPSMSKTHTSRMAGGMVTTHLSRTGKEALAVKARHP